MPFFALVFMNFASVFVRTEDFMSCCFLLFSFFFSFSFVFFSILLLVFPQSCTIAYYFGQGKSIDPLWEGQTFKRERGQMARQSTVI